MRGLDSVPLSFRNEAGEKRCPGCADWLPETSFGANKAMPDGLANRCKDCAWSAGIWSKYRITGERYRGMLDQQDGACALCLSPAKDGRLAVDHDHNCCPGARSCGKCVRSLLCLECNTSLGGFKDDVHLMQRAINYIKEYRA